MMLSDNIKPSTSIKVILFQSFLFLASGFTYDLGTQICTDFTENCFSGTVFFCGICANLGVHSVLEWIWVKGSYLSKWLPQGERGPPKESKSWWIEILHGGSQFTLWFLKIKNFQKFSDHSEIFFALQYIKNWTKVVPWKFFFCSWKKKFLV